MDSFSSRTLVAIGLAVYTLGQVAPAFVPTSAAPRAPPKFGGLPGAAAFGRQSSDSGSAGAALLAVGVGAVAGVASSLRRTSAIRRRADASDLVPGGPVVYYSKALQDAAAEKGESVGVTKDLMRLKSLMQGHPDTPFLEDLSARNTPGFTQLDEAELIIKLMVANGGPLQSKTFPAFLKFLGKKKRMMSLGRILFVYVQTLYINQSVAPVKVLSANLLTDAQKDAIKEKMKKKLQVDDVKLVVEYDVSLDAGLKLEWGFTDPDNMDVPTQFQDLSLGKYIEQAVLKDNTVPA
jgi:F0F1-type ATP synthase delta subunit